MAQAHLKKTLTEAEYLALEAVATVRHEFVGGEMHAMAGASERHNLIAGNLYLKLRSTSRAGSCRAFMTDMKLRISKDDVYYYPDVMLTCDPSDSHPMHKETPCFIAEVLSPATAKIDQRERLQAYKSIPSVHYYLIVDSDRVSAKVHKRGDGGQWLEMELSTENDFVVDCGDARCLITLDDIYQDTDLPVR